ncbi:MAG: class I SAM-dependent methyltransferase [Candidatus Woesearchaeota archaeon]
MKKDIRESYRKQVEGKKYKDYEHFRWLENFRRWLGYRQTYHALNHHLSDVDFDSVVEMGPGSGTWTKQLIRKNPEASFDLVDISEDMLKHCKINIGDRKNIKYICSDFLDAEIDHEKDLFFSARTFRYIEDKLGMLKKVHDVLRKGGIGLMITWMPRLSSKKNRDGAPVYPEEMRSLLSEAGFRRISIYPVIVRIPYFMWKKMYMKKLGKPYFLVESYIVKFKK